MGSDQHGRADRQERQRRRERAVPGQPSRSHQAAHAAGRGGAELETGSGDVLAPAPEVEHHHAGLVVVPTPARTDVVPGVLGGVLGQNGAASGEAGLAPSRSIQLKS